MRTLFEKVWDAHVVRSAAGEPDLLYVDLHLVHEVTSPQAFDGLRLAGRTVRRPDRTLAVEDHNVPTRDGPVTDPVSREQLAALRRNCAEHGIELHARGSAGQGIVHVVAPERGRTRPGMTIVCGDSHTSTHGAFGALAFGIGTTEVEHVLATQTLWATRPRSMAVEVTGALADDVTAKDLALAVVGTLGTGGGAGHVVEYRGDAVRALSMEGRMTLCNMSIEAGARAGMVAADETTWAYLRPRVQVEETDEWRTDEGAAFDSVVPVDAAAIRPYVTWGTNPSQAVPVDGVVPDGDERALAYMGLSPGTAMRDVPVDAVFVGSCTNARLSDLRAAADVVRGRRVAAGVRALVVPGSMLVKAQAEAEGLDRVFTTAGFEWRSAGCSMCLGMNDDVLLPGQRCASTSNRNFEGRQGPGARTHLVSPPVAAATAVAGRFATPADLAPPHDAARSARAAAGAPE